MAETKKKPLAGRVAAASVQVQAPKLDKQNPHFRSSYASLASWNKVIRPALAANEFAVRVTVKETAAGMTASLIAYDGEEELVLSEMPFIPGANMQQLGSATTYATRYLYAMWTGLGADDDDDGNAASTAPQPARRVVQTPPPPKQPTPEEAHKLASFADMLAQLGTNEAEAKQIVWDAYLKGGIKGAEQEAQRIANEIGA
jgi:hypothetical protein